MNDIILYKLEATDSSIISYEYFIGIRTGNHVLQYTFEKFELLEDIFLLISITLERKKSVAILSSEIDTPVWFPAIDWFLNIICFSVS